MSGMPCKSPPYAAVAARTEAEDGGGLDDEDAAGAAGGGIRLGLSAECDVDVEVVWHGESLSRSASAKPGDRMGDADLATLTLDAGERDEEEAVGWDARC